MILNCMKYPFGQFTSSVLAVFPLIFLPILSLLTGVRNGGGPDAVQTLFSNS